MLFRRLRSCVAAAITMAALLHVTTPPARADGISDKEAEARRIATEREVLIERAERLSQEQLRVEAELESLGGLISVTGAELGRQEAAVGQLREQLSEVAVRAYLFGSSSNGLNGLLRDGVSADAAVRDGYTAVVIGDRTDLMDLYRAGAEDRRKQRDTLVAAQAKQKAALSGVEQARAATERVKNDLEALEAQVTTELRDLVAAESLRQASEAEARERTAAAQRARELAAASAPPAAVRQPTSVASQTSRPTAATTRPGANLTTVAPTTARRPVTTGSVAPVVTKAPTVQPTPTTRKPAPTTTQPEIVNYPAPSGAAGIASAAAKSQLGKPYVFGAVGPDTYDCSGLMMWAWAKAGVSMPHYTGSQFNAFPHVPMSAIAPGDLVFFNIDLGHVGMYLGGGMYIHSPRTGDVVKIGSLAGRNVVGVVRPG